MPTSYQLDLRQQLVRSRYWDVLTDADIVSHYQRLGADPDFRPSFRQLCDLRDVSRIAAHTETLRDLANNSIFAPDARRAVVVSGDLDYGLARMFQTFCELAGSQVEVFRDEPSAQAWLGICGTGHDIHQPRAG